ncbi:MAG TPA: hypothetical protein PLE35_07355, partial [Lentisphaeria bacterium]|nr:hypothetical protein [Lentisphaeria bacterium]
MNASYGDHATANRPQAGTRGAENSEFSAPFACLGAALKGWRRHSRWFVLGHFEIPSFLANFDFQRQ